MASQLGTPSSGPFACASNFSFRSHVWHQLTYRRPTCPRQRPFRGQTITGLYPASYTRLPAEALGMASRFPVAFRLPAFASWTSCSRQGHSAFLTVGLPTLTGRTLSGFPCSARVRPSRGGRSLHSEAVVSSQLHGLQQPAPAAFQRLALHPANTSHPARLAITEHTRIHTRSPFRPFPCPRPPDGTATP